MSKINDNLLEQIEPQYNNSRGNIARKQDARIRLDRTPKVPHHVQTLPELHVLVYAEHQARVNRPKFEEQMKRVAFLLDRVPLEKLEEICDGKKRGFKTLLFNRVMEAIIREFERDPKPKTDGY